MQNMYILLSETSYQQTNWIQRIQYLSYLQQVVAQARVLETSAR
jgi:hypothetical protein